IAEIVPARLAVLSKAELGYRLVDNNQQQPFRSTSIRLSRKLSAEDAFRAAASSCLRQVVANEQAGDARGPEGGDPMRIRLRRLRAALAFFSKLTCADPHIGYIKRDLKWISSELAPARDLEVYLRKSVRPVDGEKPSVIGASGLERVTERRRRAAFLRARDA